MEPLHYQAAPMTPEVYFDPNRSDWYIRGNSHPGNAADFYEPLIEWVKQAVQEGLKRDVVLSIELSYFNSSSIKYLIKLLKAMEKAHRRKSYFVINWYYEDEEEINYQVGCEVLTAINLPFAFIEAEVL
jgi:hypothetical protein